ncbi:uncharacterized protein LOC118447115 [Vespa mandarinia]|uniref:uncharacterized protein LOC118447115 n=1 Tax=Vespa mandarinia TaxID=7446 RepID=UPI00160BB4E6|nr:uncharacterized protein LOC118447115 [Vespa mandarinia]
MLSKKNNSDGECSSSEDEISKEALKEATDINFLKPILFTTQTITKDSEESKEKFNNINAKSLRQNVQEDDFCNFGVSTTFKAYVAKKLDALLERTVKLDNKTNSKNNVINKNKNELNKKYGIKLLSSSINLLTDEDLVVELKNHKKRKKTVDKVTDISQFQEAAVNPEWILSKVETTFWAERHKGSVYKYKKLKDGTLIEQN